jgi:hypothetical protein
MDIQELASTLVSLDGRVEKLEHRVEAVVQFLPSLATKEALAVVDARLERVEQVLPGLATKTELQDAMSGSESRTEARLLATKTELQDAMSGLESRMDARLLATKTELQNAMSQLATRAELQAGLKAEGEASRRYMKLLIEEVKARIDLFAEAHVALEERDRRQHAETLSAHDALDGRVSALEARPKRRRP